MANKPINGNQARPPQGNQMQPNVQRMQQPHPYNGPRGPQPPRGYGHPAQAQAQTKKKHGPGFWIAIVVAALAVVTCVVFAVSTLTGEQKGTFRDPNSSLGQLDGKTREEIQAELDRVVQEGMFNISIAALAEFEDGQSEGQLKIENVPGNRYLMQVTIVRDDTGEPVYTSGIIDPNHHIQAAKLDVDLDPGSYPCTATFTALDPEDESEVGKAAAAMTILVHN